MTTLPLTEVKTRLNELVESAVTTHERVTITRNGKPAAVLVSVDDMESIEETLFWQAQPGVRDDIAAADAAAANSDVWNEEAVRGRYGVGRT